MYMYDAYQHTDKTTNDKNYYQTDNNFYCTGSNQAINFKYEIKVQQEI